MVGRIDADETRSGQRPSVFVSYSRVDLDRSRPVITLLEAAGFDVWWDGRLEGGENYLVTTETALESADCVVVLWSQQSVVSHWVRDEAQRGRERGCLVPLSLDGTMAPLGFRQFQLLDIAGWSGDPAAQEAQRILAAVRSKAGQTAPGPAPTSPLAVAAIPVSGPVLSRRAALIGGTGLAGAAAITAGWAIGLFTPAAAGAVSMVVLPFSNLTGDKSKAWFSDGLSNELRAVLVRNPRLKVAAPTSSSAIAGEDEFAIGRKLGVDHILRGSVQRDSEQMRVSAELVEINGGLVRWAESYDRAVEDVFALQSEIAETVATSLVATVASDDELKTSIAAQRDVGGTENIAAFEAFLRGHALYDLSAGAATDRAALIQFEAAIAEDPNFAAAHAMRSTMLAAIANNAASDGEESRKLFSDAIAAAEQSLALEQRLARGHLALGFALANGQLKPGAALPHYQAAERLAPGDADVLRAAASFHAYGTDRALAVRMIAQVLELDPLNARAFRTAGYIALFARDYASVIKHMQGALELNPSIASTQFAMAIARLLQGDAAGALVAAKAEQGKAYALTAIAIASHRLGDAAGSDAALASLVAEYADSRYQRAQVHAQRGEADKALTLLEKALSATDPGLLWAPNDPLLDPLRGERRFDELLLQLTS